MQRRRFGQTNRELSIASLGTMRCLADWSTFQATLNTAFELGINHIETAQGYGNSEVYVGQWLQTLAEGDRADLYITTKIPPCATAAQMAQQIDQSLTRLQVERIDALALHGVNTPEHLAWLQAPDGCMAAVRAASAAGKIRHLGFSSHGSLDLITQTLQTGWFAFVNLHYYYFHQRLEPAIALAHQLDMGVFIISPADKGGLLHQPPALLQSLCQPWTPLEFTYRFLLADPRITTLSFGPANPEELRGAIAQLPEAMPTSNNFPGISSSQCAPLNPPHANAHPSQEGISQQKSPPRRSTRRGRWVGHDTGKIAESSTWAQIHQRLQTQQRDRLGLTACKQCYACLPCPEAINIPEILRLRNLALAYDMTGYGTYRYRMLENAGHWFPGRRGDRCTDCGDCLPRCPEQLNIPQLLRQTHQQLQGKTRRRLWGDN